jgi:hypothetical protein
MVVPVPAPGLRAPGNCLLMNGITDRRPARGWKARKATDCRDSLHFREGKAYMLNFLRFMQLRNSTSYRFIHHSFDAAPSFFRPNFLILL